MKKITQKLAVSALAITALIGFQGCDFSPMKDAIDNFGVVVALEPINTTAAVLIKDDATDELITSMVNIEFIGNTRTQIIDSFSDPMPSLSTDLGILGFGLRNTVIPAETNPIHVWVQISGNDIITSEQVVSFNATGEVAAEFRVMRVSALPAGVVLGSTDAEGSYNEDGSLADTLAIGSNSASNKFRAKGRKSNQVVDEEQNARIRLLNTRLEFNPSARAQNASGNSVSLNGRWNVASFNPYIGTVNFNNRIANYIGLGKEIIAAFEVSPPNLGGGVTLSGPQFQWGFYSLDLGMQNATDAEAYFNRLSELYRDGRIKMVVDDGSASLKETFANSFSYFGDFGQSPREKEFLQMHLPTELNLSSNQPIRFVVYIDKAPLTIPVTVQMTRPEQSDRVPILAISAFEAVPGLFVPFQRATGNGFSNSVQVEGSSAVWTTNISVIDGINHQIWFNNIEEPFPVTTPSTTINIGTGLRPGMSNANVELRFTCPVGKALPFSELPSVVIAFRELNAQNQPVGATRLAQSWAYRRGGTPPRVTAVLGELPNIPVPGKFRFSIVFDNNRYTQDYTITSTNFIETFDAEKLCQ